MRVIGLVTLISLSGCCDYDYRIQYDAAFNGYYIFSCERGFEAGYGKFETLDSAVAKVKEIRRVGIDSNKRTHFIAVPK